MTNKQDIKIIIVVGMICVLIGVLIGLGASMIPEHKCIRNPLYYGISSYGNYTCTCNDNRGFNYPGFFFNETGAFPLR
jgi:hypothetical protein